MTVLNGEDSPVYLRLRGTVAAAILRGEFAAGDQLPSVRALAAEHGANPLTVAKAYQSFQDGGYVEVRRGVGMFVLPGAAERLRVAERTSFLDSHWPRIQGHIALLGLDAADLLRSDELERAGLESDMERGGA